LADFVKELENLDVLDAEFYAASVGDIEKMRAKSPAACPSRSGMA
tara:strand:- start:3625 stop:3759 length:135 start_codon:yes stop_codon:yes gene_type:complete